MLTTARTTYQSELKYSRTLPPLKVGHFASFLTVQDELLTPRCFPHYALHISPHRKLALEKSQLGFGPTGAPYEPPKKTTKHVSSDLENEPQNSGPENEEVSNCDNQETDERITFASVFYKTTNQCFGEHAKPLPVIKPEVQTIGRNEDMDLYHALYKRIGTWKTEVVPKNWEIQQQRRTFVPQKGSKSPKALTLSPKQPSLLKQRRVLNRPQVIKDDKVISYNTSKQVDTQIESKLPKILATGDCSAFQYQSPAKTHFAEADQLRACTGVDEFTYKYRLSNLVTRIPGYPSKKMPNVIGRTM